MTTFIEEYEAKLLQFRDLEHQIDELESDKATLEVRLSELEHKPEVIAHIAAKDEARRQKRLKMLHEQGKS